MTPHKKTCTKCGISQSLDQFGVNKRAKDGKRTDCNTCRNLYYLENKPRLAAKQKERLANRTEAEREATRLYNLNYFEVHRAKLLQRQKEWNATHQEELTAYWPKYYAANRDKSLTYSKAWRKAHPEERRMANKRRRASKRASVNDLTHAQWVEIQESQSHRCYYCGKRRKGKLTQDHLTPLEQGGGHTLHNVIAVCMPCNSRKGTKPPPVPVQPLLLTIAPAKPYKKKKIS